MSAEKILEKILADAKADAVEIQKKAELEAASNVSQSEAAVKLRVEAIEKKTVADSAEIERRRMLTASLDARKNSLARRRELMDRAFSVALDQFNNLSDSDYTELVTKLVVAASETGTEKVIVPSKDEKRYKGEKSVLTSLNAALIAAGKVGKLTFGGTSSSFSGGVLLSGTITDIDCSFESLVAEFREDHEMEVANILFESGV